MNRREFLGSPAALAAPARIRPPAGKLWAGTARANITPQLGAVIAGGFVPNYSADNHDELWVKSLVLDNGNTRIALALCDLCVLPAEAVRIAKEMAAAETSIPPPAMAVIATHTHSAPPTMPLFQSQPDLRYVEWLSVRIADSIRLAAGRLRPARAGWGFGKEERLAFNRRYRMKPGSIAPSPFGGIDQVKTNPGVGNPDVLGPAGPIDPAVGVLAIHGEDGAPLCVVGNYCLHYVGDVGRGHVSADYFAYWASAMARLAGVSAASPGEPFIAMLTNGCQGDVNNIDVRGSTGGRQPPYTRITKVAETLAAESRRVWRELQFRGDLELGATEEWLDLGVRLPSADDVAAARFTLADAKTSPPYRDLPLVYALETIAVSETWPKNMPVAVQALRIGDLALAAFSGEPFAAIGLEVRRQSPFRALFPIGLANGHVGYIPTAEAMELGGYETWRAKTSYLEKAAAAKVTAAMLRSLGRLA